MCPPGSERIDQPLVRIQEPRPRPLLGHPDGSGALSPAGSFVFAEFLVNHLRILICQVLAWPANYAAANFRVANQVGSIIWQRTREIARNCRTL